MPRLVKSGYVWTRYGWRKLTPKARIRAHNRKLALRQAAKADPVPEPPPDA